VSRAYVGSVHDFSLLKEEFAPEKQWFTPFKVRLDLGYLGFDKQYSCKKVYLPNRKKRSSDLTDEEKQTNQAQASKRIVIEHCIGRMKRYRILSDRLRMHNLDRYDDILGVCAGLWNFYLTA
jgi:hypothetical protein